MTTAQAVERDCPECGSAATAGQEYCLECGHRLPADRAVAGLRRRGAFSGGAGLALVTTGAVALVAAAVIAAVQLTDSESSSLLVATSPQPAVIPATVAPPAGEAETATTPEPEPAPATQPPRQRAGRLTEWPEGTSGWTVVLASVPAGQGGRSAATRQAREAVDQGLPRVGVLTSSRFSSLHPGYLVVFSGVYSNRSAAEQAVSRARAGGSQSAYSREIVP